jgi:hypothetical protein
LGNGKGEKEARSCRNTVVTKHSTNMATEKKPSEGSMAAAEQKENKPWIIGLTVLMLLIYCTFWVPSSWYPAMWFRNAGIWAWVGTISALAHLVFFFLKIRNVNEEANAFPAKTVGLFIGWFAINLAMLGGWDFSY